MMRYNNIINGLFVIASITAFAACTEDTYDNSAAEGNGVFQFSGLPSIYTRADVSADDDQKAFEAGTKYQLFAVENDNWNTNYLQKTPSKNAIEGTETNEHTISFDGNNKFNNHSLNFYAVTLSDKEYVPEIKYNTDNSAPTCYVSYDIAGKGLASEDSFRQAVYVAIDVFRNRQREKVAHANPLRKQYYEKRDDSDKLKLDTFRRRSKDKP